MKSLINYIDSSGGFIDNSTALAVEPPPMVQEAAERPALVIAHRTTVTEDLESQVVPEPQPEPQIEVQQPVLEHSLQHSITELQRALAEQQNTQIQLTELIGALFESVNRHSTSIDQRFQQLDVVLQAASDTLLETSEKLAAINAREITVPAPVVNVSLSEQKRIVKTVDRDGNGLIRQITEDIQQTIVEDK